MSRAGESQSGGLGPQLVGEKITINGRLVTVMKQLGEGGFSFVYMVKDISENSAAIQDGSFHGATGGSAEHSGDAGDRNKGKDSIHLVLKITSIHSRQQRDIAEKEAKLLSRLSHPSIVRISDSCYRTIPAGINEGGSKLHHIKLGNIVGGTGGSSSSGKSSGHALGSGGNNGQRPQHLILMEYCEGGTALSVCNSLKSSNKIFDLPSLIIAFGQICNAVSYLHAQRPPIVHRDLKPVNFLVKNGAYKLCDFGSAVFGHIDLRTPRARSDAEEIVQKTTTQMFRSPEMVDLYMSKKLTQSTDVWALGCCLYSLAFLQDCFELGSNLAILSRNFKIPENNPYGDGLVELIDRMLTVNCKERADMTEVILCLSAIYSGRPLPPRKISKSKGGKKSTVGAFRTDGQGIRESIMENKKPVEAKKLNPNSAAARRRKAAQTTATDQKVKNDAFEFGNFHFSTQKSSSKFSGADDPFQIGEGTENRGSKSSQDESYDFPRDSTFISPDGNEKIPFSDDIDLDFNKFNIDDTSSNRRDMTDNRGSTSSLLDNQFRERNHGVMQRDDNQRRRKKKGSGTNGFHTQTSKQSESEI